MALYVTSKQQARRHGVFAMEKTPPAAIRAINAGTVGYIEQFPWGPDQAVTYSSDTATMISTFAPAGMSRTGSGYLGLIRKAFSRLGVVRVLGTTAAAATATLATSTPTNVLTVTAKYKGTAGNSLTWTVSAADDGNANHFNLTVSVTGASGTTTETIHNLNISGTGADVLPSAADYNRCVLIGSVAKIAAGIPVAGSGSFAGGTDGSIISSDWTGTQGTANRGIALFEGDKTMDVVVTGDPGNTLRAAVNAALQGHADLMTDRMVFINGNSGQTAAQAQTDVASYRSQRVAYIDVWAYIYDDVDGTKRLVPSAIFAASVASQLPPSTSIAWKSAEVRAMLNGIVDLEAQRGNTAADNTDAGIVTLMKEDTGGYSFESAKNTYHAVDATRGSIKRTRMGHYIAKAITTSLRPYVDSPNVPYNQNDEIGAVDEFLSGLKRNAAVDPNHLVHIADYDMPDVSTLNPQASLDAGEFTIGADVKISSDQEKIFFLHNFGETVQVTAQL